MFKLDLLFITTKLFANLLSFISTQQITCHSGRSSILLSTFCYADWYCWVLFNKLKPRYLWKCQKKFYYYCCQHHCFVWSLQHDLELIFESFKCKSLDKTALITHSTCGIGKNPKRPTMNMELQFSRIVNHFDLNLAVSIPRKPRNFVILNLTKTNGCNLLSNNNSITLLQIGRNIIDRYSNFPKGCPFLKDVLYYIKGMRVNMDMLPAFNFETELVSSSEWIIEKKKVFIVDQKIRIAMKTKKGGRPK